MESNALMSLINQGEDENVDFKLELHLDTAEQKAEFVKDIISLANSASEIGFLIIGVDNLLARAKAYRMNFELSMEDYLDTDIGSLAFKDLSDAFCSTTLTQLRTILDLRE